MEEGKGRIGKGGEGRKGQGREGGREGRNGGGQGRAVALDMPPPLETSSESVPDRE